MPTVAGLSVSLAFAVVTILSLFLPVFRVAFSALSIFTISIVLLMFFVSLVRKGQGSKRTIGDVLIVSLVGTFSMPFLFASIYSRTGIYKSGSTEAMTGIYDAIYFSFVTWTTLGYGDIVPSEASRVVVIAEVGLGYTLMALLIAALVRSIQRDI
jgi:hypothetical protein